jgi:hypothetical protein
MASAIMMMATIAPTMRVIPMPKERLPTKAKKRITPIEVLFILLFLCKVNIVSYENAIIITGFLLIAEILCINSGISLGKAPFSGFP